MFLLSEELNPHQMKTKHTQLIWGLLLFTALFSITVNTRAQNCIQTSQWPTGTVTIASTGTTNVVTNNWAGEYSINNFVAAGIYSISAVGGSSNYLTITDNNNNPIGSGYSIVGVVIPSAGLYRIHVSTGTGCGTESISRSVNVWPAAGSCTNSTQYPGSTVGIASLGNTTLTTCNWGGDYAVTSFTAAGIYTISTSPTSFLTVKNVAGTILYASGTSPLPVNIPGSGTYYIHINSSGPSACGTDVVCKTTVVMGPTPIVPPSNDQCSGATLLSVPSTTAGTTVNATTETPSPGNCVTTLNQPGVWYRVVGNGNQFGADLCSTTTWDSKMFVYAGSCGALTCVTGIDDGGPICPTSAAASVTWCSIPGVDYYILVTGYNTTSPFNISVTQTVNTGANPVVVINPASPSVCLTSSIALTASGAGSYVWETGATTTSIAVTPLATTVYTVYGKAASTCNFALKTVTVTSLSNPTISLSSNNGSVCPAGIFTTTPSGAVSYTFNGSPSGTVVVTGPIASLSPIVNTTYTVSGTASNGCRSLPANAATATVMTLSSPVLTTAATPSVICAGQSANITVTGANTYTWNGTTVANNINVSPVVTTIYTVAGTGTTICNGVKTHTIVVNPLPNISVNSGTLCEGSNFIMVGSGASTYTFLGQTGTVSAVVSPSASTSYSMIGFSAQGCLSPSMAVSNIAVTPRPVVSLNTGSICVGDQFMIVPSGASTYTMIGGVNPVTPSVTSDYTVTGTSGVGCISLPAITTVTVFALPSLSITANASVTCAGEEISLTASGASSYTWNAVQSGATFTAAPPTTTVYFVYGTDAQGCTAFITHQASVNPVPAVSIINNNTFVCSGASASLVATGALNYSWTTTDITNVIMVNPTVTTVYGVVGTNSFGCAKTVTSAVTVNTIVLSLTSNTTICEGGDIDLTATGPTSYTWTHNNSHFNQVNVSPTVTTTYQVIGKDGKNCMHSGAVTVSVNPNPVVNASATQETICIGETATLTASGATTYSWGTEGAGSSIMVTPILSIPHVYVVTGTDANGCSNTATITVTGNKCVGINEFNTLSGLSVYPNPNTGNFVIELNNGAAKMIEVCDVTGRIVHTDSSETASMSVDISNFANGVYYVKITSGDKMEVVRIIKQ